MKSPSLPILDRAIEGRYAELADSCCSLSCGEALGLAAPASGETLVDLGCGRGQDVIRAAGRIGPKGAAIGVDRTAAMIEKARASVPPFLKNVRFVCCDLAALDLPDTTADVVISNCTTELLQGIVPLDPWGCVQTDESMQTGVPGLFAAGDIRAKPFRQITTAVADGTIAALAAQKYLRENPN
jgi:SAM-dependent methyltransferase